ncbi:hypothetical protein CLV42_12651 [Chitinophaga ginsengisoli]|uniref:Uncharacterized protein n=1 Tax=Chitinophaga ginsengisoli TaxID=363837 RepID=A0A2P8FE48_9BACT|nr:hypothetical protein CLV42_12651 [Chitinophaga ginsengisoli]
MKAGVSFIGAPAFALINIAVSFKPNLEIFYKAYPLWMAMIALHRINYQDR